MGKFDNTREALAIANIVVRQCGIEEIDDLDRFNLLALAFAMLSDDIKVEDGKPWSSKVDLYIGDMLIREMTNAIPAAYRSNFLYYVRVPSTLYIESESENTFYWAFPLLIRVNPKKADDKAFRIMPVIKMTFGVKRIEITACYVRGAREQMVRDACTLYGLVGTGWKCP